MSYLSYAHSRLCFINKGMIIFHEEISHQGNKKKLRVGKTIKEIM